MKTTANNNRENVNRVNNATEPEALRGATLQELERHSDRTAAPAWLKPGATFKRTMSDGREVVAICTRLLLDGFAYIIANGCAVVDHVAAFAGYNFDGLTPCDIDDNAPKFARMLRNFHRIRKGFEEYQTAHPYTANDTASEEEGAPVSEGEGETEAAETWRAGYVTVTKTADTITTTENGRTDAFEIVTEWPANYYVWNIGREHFPVPGYLPLCKDGVNVESWQRNIDRDHLKAIKVQSEAAALACMDYACHHDRPTHEDLLQVLAQYPADPLADIIREAKQQESRTASGLNYGPIKYLRDRVLYATNGKTTAENMTEYEENLHRVTDADTYAAYLLSSYDVFVDETQVFCDLRRAFPSLTFAELCRLIRDHMSDEQQGNGIAAALVPDVVILSSSDEYTREKFRERHEKFYKLSSYWKGEEENTTRERDLKKYYDRESLALHALLSAELFYLWEDDRAARCLESVREIYPDMTAQELHNIRDKYAPAISEIYG